MYQLVSEKDVEIFKSKVSELLEDGYILHGDLIVITDGYYPIYNRELVKLDINGSSSINSLFFNSDCKTPFVGTCSLETTN